jgi:alpha-glucuronidase
MSLACTRATARRSTDSVEGDVVAGTAGERYHIGPRPHTQARRRDGTTAPFDNAQGGLRLSKATTMPGKVSYSAGMWLRFLLLGSFLVVGAPAAAEDGYRLWLRYDPVPDASLRSTYASALTALVARGDSPTERAVVAELSKGLEGLLGRPVARGEAVTADGALVVGTPSRQPAIAGLGLESRLRELGPEGYVIRTANIGGRRVRVIASAGEAGTVYGAFHFLRLLQTGRSIDVLDIAERPRLARRLLNHWDNLDGTIERGYAGNSLWKWDELPGVVDPRVTDYARANASLGLNGTVINSVNANPRSLTTAYLQKAAAIADVLRPWGIRVYLAANFAAPRQLGDLPTTDPQDARVAGWWKLKAAEIYKHIPDFGGFVVKANSEGQPGPQDYGRTHAEGANVLADALAPHGGIVMWRAFVYNADVDPDRVKRAYMEFVPIDDQFRQNVFVQVKNGPLDFQPREPFHPLFGAITTPVMTELQITQEYFGHSTHMVYLAPMWREFFDADTYARGPGSTITRIADGSLTGETRTGIAGVANTGSDRNWTGHHMAQANWYAFGRLAWNPAESDRAIAEDWIRQTWSHDPTVVSALASLLLDTYETYVDYTMPLGLHHLIGGDHYAPMPENPDPRRADWSAIYYHRADDKAVGFDRTPSGSNAVGQYRSPLREQWADPKTTPENLLLWFHRLPWDYRLKDGQTLWQGIVAHYTRGAERAQQFVTRWDALKGKVDAERHAAVAAKLKQQAADAVAWRAKCLKYFAQFSGGAM